MVAHNGDGVLKLVLGAGLGAIIAEPAEALDAGLGAGAIIAESDEALGTIVGRAVGAAFGLPRMVVQGDAPEPFATQTACASDYSRKGMRRWAASSRGTP